MKQVEKKQKKQGFFSSSAFRHGSMATVFIIVFIIAIILVNIVATALAERYPLTIDLTANKDFTMSLSEEHEAFVKGIERDVRIVFCVGEGDIEGGIFANYMSMYGMEDSTVGTKYYTQLVAFLEGFKKMNSHISLVYRNPYSSTEFNDIAAKYSGSEEIQYGDIIVECSFPGASGEQVERYQILTVDDIFEKTDESGYAAYGYDSYKISGSKLETSLTSALYIVTSEESVKGTVIGGHGSEDTAGLQSLLKKNNYTFNTVTNLLTETIPSDSQFIVICGPTIDFSAEEIEKISEFLDNGGNKGKFLFYAAAPAQEKLPNLEEFLEEWGIAFTENVVYEQENGTYSNMASYVLASDAGSEYTEGFDSNSMFYYPMVYRTAKVLFDTEDYYATTPILVSSDSAVGMPYDATETWKPDQATEKGPFDLLVKATNYSSTTADAKESYVLACASSGFIYDQVLTTSSAANASLILNLFNDMSGVDSNNQVEITPKTIQSTSFSQKLLDSSMPTVMKWIFLGLVPVGMLVAGLIIWVRRKNL